MANILVVDDDIDVRAAVSAILDAEGHSVRSVGNGARALDEVARAIPDLIVLDLCMPEMDGWRFMEELYDRGLRDKTRVVVISGFIDHVARSSAAHVLQKPFDPEDLLGAIDDAMSRSPEELVEALDRTDALARLMIAIGPRQD